MQLTHSIFPKDSSTIGCYILRDNPTFLVVEVAVGSTPVVVVVAVGSTCFVVGTVVVGTDFGYSLLLGWNGVNHSLLGYPFQSKRPFLRTITIVDSYRYLFILKFPRI